MTTMKKIICSLLLSLPLGVGAQTLYDVTPFMDNDLTGTSRFISMGGSMGALGGDISVMGTNPAGIALYRRSDFSFTGSLNFNNTKAKYNKTSVSSDYASGDVESMGAVLANKMNDGGSLKFLNVGMGYRRKNGLSREFEMAGPADGFSQQYVIRDLYDNNPFDMGSIDGYSYSDFYYSWLPLLATYANIVDVDGNLITTPDGELIYNPTDIGFIGKERGGVSEVDVNLAANFSDRVYVGATLSFANVDYSTENLYYENDEIGEIYSIGNYNHIEGTGFGIKLGTIIRPFKYSPFKFGLAVHTPTWYSLKSYSYADIQGPFEDFYDTRDWDLYDGELRTQSKFRTPWRFSASASYTIGSAVALNAEYEYADYSSAKFGRVGLGGKNAQNEEIKYNLKEQHTVRLGAEFNLNKNFSLRAGYNYSTAPFRKDAYKSMYNMPVTSTSTEYINRFDREAVSLGAGYRGKMFYFDMAYVLQTQEADFYPFADPEYYNPAAEVEFTDHTITATLGIKF